MKDNYKKCLIPILKLKAFEDTFSKLSQIDAEKTEEIKKSINALAAGIHTEIEKNYDNPSEIKYLLCRESGDLRNFSVGFINYAEKTASREKALWEFAFGLTERFFELIDDALAQYFEFKKRLMTEALEKDFNIAAGLNDAVKKGGALVNKGKSLLKKGMDKFDSGFLNDEDVFNTKTLVENILDRFLNPKIVSEDIAAILEHANEHYREKWEEEIKNQTPDLKKLQTVLFSAAGVNVNSDFELDAAGQTFAVGISGAIAATFGLAAGWHTISYAISAVFPPAALFAVLGTAAMAVLTKDKALDKKKKQIEEAVNEYHKYFLLQIETAKLKELGGITLREAMNEQSKKIIRAAVDKWNEVISGKYKPQHYNMLTGAFERHLLQIKDCIEQMEERNDSMGKNSI